MGDESSRVFFAIKGLIASDYLIPIQEKVKERELLLDDQYEVNDTLRIIMNYTANKECPNLPKISSSVLEVLEDILADILGGSV
jgi:hypothetical protein